MKQAFIFAALALVAAFPARAGQEVCFDVLTNIRDDNGREVMQRVCAEEGKPLPVKLRMVEEGDKSMPLPSGPNITGWPDGVPYICVTPHECEEMLSPSTGSYR